MGVGVGVGAGIIFVFLVLVGRVCFSVVVFSLDEVVVDVSILFLSISTFLSSMFTKMGEGYY